MTDSTTSLEGLKNYILRFNEYNLDSIDSETLLSILTELKSNFIRPFLRTKHTLLSLGLSNTECWLVKSQLERINTLFTAYSHSDLGMHERYYDTTQRQLDILIAERLHIPYPKHT